MDPSVEIARALSREGLLNIYQLSKKLGWTYGKCERQVARMIEDHQLFSATIVENGRMTRLVSTKPIDSTKQQETSENVISGQVMDAFKHLYGVFKALKEANIDPSAGLARYCKDRGMKPSELISIFDDIMTGSR